MPSQFLASRVDKNFTLPNWKQSSPYHIPWNPETERQSVRFLDGRLQSLGALGATGEFSFQGHSGAQLLLTMIDDADIELRWRLGGQPESTRSIVGRAKSMFLWTVDVNDPAESLQLAIVGNITFHFLVVQSITSDSCRASNDTISVQGQSRLYSVSPDSGAPGDAVHVFGDFFATDSDSDLTVTFGTSTSDPCTILNSSCAICTVPAGERGTTRVILNDDQQLRQLPSFAYFSYDAPRLVAVLRDPLNPTTLKVSGLGLQDGDQVLIFNTTYDAVFSQESGNLQSLTVYGAPKQPKLDVFVRYAFSDTSLNQNSNVAVCGPACMRHEQTKPNLVRASGGTTFTKVLILSWS